MTKETGIPQGFRQHQIFDLIANSTKNRMRPPEIAGKLKITLAMVYVTGHHLIQKGLIERYRPPDGGPIFYRLTDWGLEWSAPIREMWKRL